MSDAYGTFFWKHFKKAIIWLVELNRISRRHKCRVYFQSIWKQRCCGAKPPNERRKPSCLQMWREHLSGSTKRWIFKSMWNIKSLWHRIFKIHPRVSHTSLLLWWHFHAPKHDSERNKLRLFVCLSNSLMGRPWPMKAAIYFIHSAVSLKVWQRETMHWSAHLSFFKFRLNYAILCNINEKVHNAQESWGSKLSNDTIYV